MDTRKLNFDHILFMIVMFLILFGIIMIFSSSAIFAIKEHNNPTYFVKRQIIFFIISFVLFIGAMNIDIYKLKENTNIIILALFFLSLLVFVPHIGQARGGAKRWLNLVFFFIQTSELVKLGIVIYLANYVDENRHRMKDFKTGFLKPFTIPLIFCFLIYIQPDLSTSIIIASISVGILYIGGTNILYIIISGLAGFVGVLFSAFIYSYHFNRILGFLDPFADPTGKGWQIIQSWGAFINGGWVGKGLGESLQKQNNLPAAHTDFIFSVIAEELGVFGFLIILSLYFVLIYRGFTIAKNTKSLFEMALASGITLIIGIQVAINAMVVTGLMPATGVTLPLISYGGSSLISTMLGCGILLNISGRI